MSKSVKRNIRNKKCMNIEYTYLLQKYIKIIQQINKIVIKNVYFI